MIPIDCCNDCRTPLQQKTALPDGPTLLVVALPVRTCVLDLDLVGSYRYLARHSCSTFAQLYGYELVPKNTTGTVFHLCNALYD
eukprot:COSAG05_NODE_163_length_15471_cov_29.575072_8_plen_84_part_00